MTPKPTAIFVGASAGGIEAVQKLLQALPAHFHLPIIVSQHIARDAKLNLSLVFGRFTSMTLLEALDKEPIRAGCAYFAPPDYHLMIEKDLTLSLSQDAAVHYARPSIDVLFESAAMSLGSKACGVLLTGANEDGAAGLLAIQSAGGLTMVQNPDTAAARSMPEAALKLMKPHFCSDVPQIARRLAGIVLEGVA